MAYNTDIERLNYYEGEFLGAIDFQDEQEYHRDMRRRHNLGQHTWGIVAGLELAQAPNGNMDGTYTEVDVYLQPGMAVDGFGREIVALNQAQLTTDMLAAFYNPNPAATPITVYIWVAYQQALLQPPSDACTSMNVSNAYGRVQETYTLSATSSSTAPPSGAMIVAGSAMSPPPEPSPTAPPPTPAPVTDPPSITLPYDDSVPFQEFSTDDSNLFWWIALGQVMWDPYNQVFVQSTGNSASAGRDYAGNVSATAYAPAGIYAIVDRNSPYPLPINSSDPNYGGVQAEVAGSLLVDRNAQVGNSLSVDQNNLNDGTSLNPGLSFGASSGEGIASQRTGTGQYDLNFYTGSVVQMTIASNANGGGVSVTGSLNVDQANKNDGTSLNPGLSFGLTSGEGIASQRTGTGQYDLNFYTGSAVQMNIASATSGGQVSVTNGFNVDQADKNNGTSLNPGLSFGAGSGEGIASQRTGTGQYDLNFYTGGAVQMSIASAANGGNVSVTGSLNVDQANLNTGAGVSPGLTFGLTSGEGIASQRTGANRFGLNFYTGYGLRMSIQSPANGAGVTIGGPSPVNANVPAPGALTINGNRTYLLGTDLASNHWIMAGGTLEGLNNAIGFSYDSFFNLGQITVPPNWTLTATSKVGYVADRFINRNGEPLERGDLVVIHQSANGKPYGGSNVIPLVEVERTTTPQDPRVCGIVDEPLAPGIALQDLDPKQIAGLKIGRMVTLGAYGYCKVDADVAPIAAGDLLTTSSIAGYAQKLDAGATHAGVVIAKALAPLAKGRGLIPVMISHQ